MLLFQFIRLLLRAIDIYMMLISAYVICTWFPQARNMTCTGGTQPASTARKERSVSSTPAAPIVWPKSPL